MRTRTVTEVRSHLSQYIRDAEAGILTMISRRGEDVAVLMAIRDWEALNAAIEHERRVLSDTHGVHEK